MDGNFQSEKELQKYYEVMEPLYSVTSQNKSADSKVKTKRSYKALNKGFGGFLRTYDVINDLVEITIPTLVIAGRYDWITPVSENYIIHEKITDSSFHVMVNSSHNVFVDEQDEFIKLVSEFLAKTL